MFHQANLQRNGGRFSGMENVGILTNVNDFLLTDSDLAWIDRTFPEDRRIINERGGHLGCLADADVREAAVELLRSLQKNAPTYPTRSRKDKFPHLMESDRGA